MTVTVAVCVPERLETAGEMNNDTEPLPTAAELMARVEVAERIVGVAAGMLR